MLKKLKALLSRAEGQDNLKTLSQQEATFLLFFRNVDKKNLDIGKLWLRDGYWHFEYTESFKKQSHFEPLPDFPQLEKLYRSHQLWPFFSLRIPSLKQPQIEKTILREGLDRDNEVELLSYFGKRTIANPFQLKPLEEEKVFSPSP